MGFQDAVRTCFNKYVTISGRASRSEYWWWILFIFVANLVLTGVDRVLFGGDISVFSALFGLAIILPTICAAGRRLHDRDMSAWWLLLTLIPVIGSLILLVLYILPGTDGPNRFGPDPLKSGAGRSASVWDADDDSFTRSSVPKVDRDDS